MKKQNFNLVEIIIAMGIVVVCITTIMGLFSVGMQVSNDAVMRTYSNNIIEQLGGFAETHPKATSGSAIPNSKQSPESGTWASIKTAEEACTTQVDADDPFFKNVYMAGTSVGILKIQYQTTVNSSSVVDFTAIARLWYEGSSETISTTDNGGTGTVTLTDAKTLNIEISWPDKIPYKNRILSGDFISFEKVMNP